MEEYGEKAKGEIMNKKVIKIKNSIKEIINEHNNIWKDISNNLKYCNLPPGYNCFNLKEEDIITIASGLIKKGIK